MMMEEVYLNESETKYSKYSNGNNEKMEIQRGGNENALLLLSSNVWVDIFISTRKGMMRINLHFIYQQ
jgi:hypothetical protein